MVMNKSKISKKKNDRINSELLQHLRIMNIIKIIIAIISVPVVFVEVVPVVIPDQLLMELKENKNNEHNGKIQ